MGLETATFIADLVASNPGSGDLRSQGDDHLRLVKAVLQATFPTASKAWYNPTTATKSADFTVVAADMNKTFLVDTTAGVINMTLPSLVAGDAGWECFMVKTNSGVSPVLIKPTAGTLSSGAITGLAAARRAIPGARIRCFWTGTVFQISRAPGAGGPVGSTLPLHVAGLPVGYEYPNGQTLASASTNYPEFYSVNGSSGVTLDVRGRNEIPLDNLGGGAAGRVTTAGGAIDGTTLGAVGGGQNVVLVTPNLPPYTPAGSVASSTTSSANAGFNYPGSPGNVGVGGGASGGNLLTPPTYTTTSTFTGTAQGGTSTAVKILGPGIVVNKVLVVE